jgi:hypothetical protein
MRSALFLLGSSATAFAATLPHLASRDTSPAPATSLPDGWSYTGCYIDAVTPRSLADASTYNAASMSAETCIAFCADKGYPIAGTEYGAECYCGSALPNIAPEQSDCSMPCAGNPTEACGAGYRLSVYSNPNLAKTTTNPGVDGWSSLGCVSDSQQDRTLKTFMQVDGGMTVAKCVAACSAASFDFAGVEVRTRVPSRSAIG